MTFNEKTPIAPPLSRERRLERRDEPIVGPRVGFPYRLAHT
jgi:hypothetical protein